MMDYRISDKMRNMKPSVIREIFKSLGSPDAISFAAGNPAAESFPVDRLAPLAAEIFENDAVAALQYSVTEGYAPLISDITKRLHDKFGIGRDYDRTVITTGGQQGIELACKVLCNEGDAVICEEPTFIGALNAFRSLGARPVGVPLENDGINTALLRKALEDNRGRVGMIYLIPTFQNPSGITTCLKKRQEILALANEFSVPVFEDNPYGELRFDGEELPTLKSLDENGSVIYCSSFSKILSAGMRVGFVCAPDAVIQKLVVAKQVEDVHTNIFFQKLCHLFIERCDLDAHISFIRALYLRKSRLMLGLLEKTMPEGVTFTRPEGGLFMYLNLPECIDIPTFCRSAADRNVFVVPGNAFSCDERTVVHSVRITYATPTEEQIERGIPILAGLVREMLA